MAGSLDELIEFLLEEITFSGESGLTFRDLAGQVQQFYNPTKNQQQSTDVSDISNAVSASSIDRAFLSKVWNWLGRHPDVSIGKDKEYNTRSLDEIEGQFPGYTNLTESVADTEALPSTSDDPVPGIVTDSAAQNGPDRRPGPRIAVSDERMSIAICGHPPDPTRVFPSEWTLLVCISKTRTDGILQGDLVRDSGQDKRSVPKRTDMLQEKGYIFKKIIYIKGNKTSRIFLRKFAESHRQTLGSTTTADQLTVRHLARQLFDVLKNNPLIPHEDLSDALGMTRPGRVRILSQLIRHFSKAGCIKRVKTAFGPSARSKDLKVCIQFLKDPTDEDWYGPKTDNIDFDQAAETLASLYEYETGQSGINNDDEVNNNEFEEEENDLYSFATLQDVDHPVRSVLPQWNPDRILANVLFEMAKEAGSEGLRNVNARNTITGPFIKRTLESLLVKLSNRALQAQPSDLRHLAIVRSHKIHDGILQYLHFTFEAFANKVKDNQARWPDVSGGENYLKELQKQENSMSNNTEAPTTVDPFGFAVRAKPSLQVRDGEVTMAQLLQDGKAKAVGSRIGEPYLKEIAPGKFEIRCLGSTSQVLPTTKSPGHPWDGRHKHQEQPASILPVGKNVEKQVLPSPTESAAPPSASKKVVRTPKHVDEHGRPIKGRPRKFVRGTEKYWRDVFAFIVQARDPGRMKDYGKAGVTNDPQALKIFNKRPANFDQTVLQAMELGLPVASEISDISQDWIDKITAIIHRDKPGLYITPSGFQIESRRKMSQHVIFRSTRLAELDLSDRRKCWLWQSLSSSASHSFRYQRYYPRLGTTPRHIVKSLRRNVDTERSEHMSDPTPEGPPRGVFYEDMQSTAATYPDPNVPIASQRPGYLERLEIGESTDATDSDVEAQNNTSRKVRVQTRSVRRTKPSKTDSVPKMNATQGASNPPQSNPTPLMVVTRSARKRKATQKVVENREILGVDQTEIELTATSLPNDTILVTIETADTTTPSTTLPTTPVASSQRDLFTTGVVETEQLNSELERSTPQADSHDSTKTGLGDEAHLLHAEIYNSEDTQAACRDENVDLAETHRQEEVEIHQREYARDHPGINDHEVLAIPGNDAEVSFTTAPLAQSVDVGQSIPENEASYDGHHSERQDQTINEVVADSMPESRKRSRAPDEVPSRNEQGDQTTQARKRLKVGDTLEIARRQVSKLCRIMVLELVGLCSGLAPNVPWTLRRAMVPRWQEAGVKPDQLNAKNVRAAIKALCENGKLKQFTFAFRAKSGSMVKMSVIALRGIDATNPAIIDLQKKMSDMAPADYIPPELEAEEKRAPNELNKKRYSKEIRREESPDDLDEQPPSRPSRKRRVKGKPQEKKETEQADTTEAMSPPLSPLPEPEITSNTGFLTLKVPQIGKLKLPAAPEYRFKLPPVPIRFETDPNALRSSTAEPTRKALRRSGLRRKRTSRFDPETHKLIWKKPKYKLPLLLDDIPNINISRDEAALSATGDVRSLRFEAEVDCVASWEEKSSDLLEEKRTEHPIFINHTFTREISDAKYNILSIEFKAIIRFDTETGEEIEADFPETESWPAFITALQVGAADFETSTPKARGKRRARKPSKRKADAAFVNDLVDVDNDEYAERVAKRQRLGDLRKNRPRRTLHSMQDDEADGTSNLPLKRYRWTQLLRHMTEEEKYKVVVAVVLVRTLVGGIEKFVDWKLVTRLLPSQPEHSLKDAWKTMSNRYRNDISELTEGLQHQYLDALSGNEAPTINFDSVHESDWESLFRWALQNLDKSIVKKIEELPASRSQLLRRNDYAFTEFRGIRELVSYNAPQTIPRKEETVSGIVFGKPLIGTSSGTRPLGVKFPAEEEELDHEFSRAKSWVMATLLTPETTKASVIQAKLLTLASTPRKCEAILEKAVKSLQRDKTISKSNRLVGVGRGNGKRSKDIGRFAHLRAYEASTKFFEQFDFRRLVTTTMLKRAAKYKLDVLDATFTQNSTITLAEDTILDDGEMVAILNLHAMGMLQFRPGSDVPASRWGLQWQKHGYTTRMIDKRALGFSVVVSPIQHSYVTGDPLAHARNSPAAAIPRGEIDREDRMGRIPVWFDITHTFQPELWEMVLGATLGLISTRPGIGARELVRTFWHGISVGEVEMVLLWAEQHDLIRRTGLGSDQNGWECCEWWWLGVGVGGGWNVHETSSVDEAEAEVERGDVDARSGHVVAPGSSVDLTHIDDAGTPG